MNKAAKINLFLNRLPRLIVAVLSAYYPNERAWICESSAYFFEYVMKLQASRGIEYTVKYVKVSRNAYLRSLSGEPLSECDLVKLKGGEPKWLSTISQQVGRDPVRLRIFLTYLTSLRSITLPPKLDTETITSPSLMTDDITDLELWRVYQALHRGARYFGVCTGPHMSTKKGPVGQAIMSSISELTFLPRSLIDDISLLGGSELSSNMESLTDRLDILDWSSVADWWISLHPLSAKAARDRPLRKISYFSDKEGKTRVIAILDYWSQSALRPLHTFLGKLLRKIPVDMTYNQGAFTPVDHLKGAERYHSIDLSAATDRMPILLQKRVLHLLMTKDKVDCWHRLLTGYPFRVSDGSEVRYSVGQPMGAYSSWPIMALTHHYIVRIAAMRAGFPATFSDYFLLGDDLVIYNDLVAESYKMLISTLGMPYSEEKTHVSIDTFEFAKRWFHKGVEITGFSIGGLLSTYERYPLLHNFLLNQSHHGWVLPIERHPGLITEIFSIMKKPHYIVNKVNSMIKLYLLFDGLISWKTNQSQEAAETIFKRLEPLAPADFWLHSFPSVTQAFKMLLYTAKYHLIESDLSKFQTDTYVINSDINRWVDDKIGKDRPHDVKLFLKETLSVVIGHGNPVVGAINTLIDQSIDYLTSTVLASEETLVPDFILSHGLSKYFVSRGVFTMRASHSIALAESAVVKKILSILSKREPPATTLTQIPFHDKVLQSGFIPIPRFLIKNLVRLATRYIRVVKPTTLYRLVVPRARTWVVPSLLVGLITYSGQLPTLLTMGIDVWASLTSSVSSLELFTEFPFDFSGILLGCLWIVLRLSVVYILMLLAVGGSHYSLTLEAISYLVHAFQEGVITLPNCVYSIWLFLHQAMLDVSIGIIPSLQVIEMAVLQGGPVIQFISGALLAQLLLWFVRWLTGL